MTVERSSSDNLPAQADASATQRGVHLGWQSADRFFRYDPFDPRHTPRTTTSQSTATREAQVIPLQSSAARFVQSFLADRTRMAHIADTEVLGQVKVKITEMKPRLMEGRNAEGQLDARLEVVTRLLGRLGKETDPLTREAIHTLLKEIQLDEAHGPYLKKQFLYVLEQVAHSEKPQEEKAEIMQGVFDAGVILAPQLPHDSEEQLHTMEMAKKAVSAIHEGALKKKLAEQSKKIAYPVAKGQRYHRLSEEEKASRSAYAVALYNGNPDLPIRKIAQLLGYTEKTLFAILREERAKGVEVNFRARPKEQGYEISDAEREKIDHYKAMRTKRLEGPRSVQRYKPTQEEEAMLQDIIASLLTHYDLPLQNVEIAKELDLHVSKVQKTKTLINSAKEKPVFAAEKRAGVHLGDEESVSQPEQTLDEAHATGPGQGELDLTQPTLRNRSWDHISQDDYGR